MNERRDEIHALADGELEPESRARLSEVLLSDRSAQKEYQWALVCRHVVRQKCGGLQDEEAWLKARARLDELDRASRTERFVGRYAWGICGAFLLALVLAGTLNRTSGYHQVTNAHMASLMSGLTPVRVAPTSDPATANSVLRSVIGQAPIQTCPDESMLLTSVATGTIGGRLAARLTLEDDRGPMTLFLVRGAGGFEGVEPPAEREFARGEMMGRPCVSWNDSGFALLLTGSRSQEDLEQVATAIRIHPD